MDELGDPAYAALARRLAACWERLDDVVSELIEVHEVPAREVLACVDRSFEPIRPSDET
jgi:hypothetical protein